MTGGLPASPPVDIDAIRHDLSLILEDSNGEPYMRLAQSVPVLLAEVERLRALGAARDTDETTLRAHIAEQIRERLCCAGDTSRSSGHQMLCDESYCETAHDAARIAEGAGS